MFVSVIQPHSILPAPPPWMKMWSYHGGPLFNILLSSCRECVCVRMCVCVELETNILSTAAASSAPDPLLTLLPGAHLGTSTFDMRCRLVTAGVAAPEEVLSNIYVTSDLEIISSLSVLPII